MSIRIIPVLGRGYVLYVDNSAQCDSSDFQFLLDCAVSLISGTALVLNH